MSQRCRRLSHLNESMSYHHSTVHVMVVDVTVTPVFVSVPNSGPSHTKSVVVQFQVILPFVEFQVYVPLAVYVPVAVEE